MDRKSMGDGFFHDEGVGWDDLGELIGDPACIDRFLVFPSQRLFFPLCLSRFMTAAPRLHALPGVSVALDDSFFDAVEKILQRAFDVPCEDLIDRITPIGKIR